MSLPVKEIPFQIKKSLQPYRMLFSKRQFKHFTNFVFGLIVSDRKNIQEINDCFGKCNQSSLNRFFTTSKWNTGKINKMRLCQVRKHLDLGPGIFIIDPTMLHKTGREMEKANFHYSGKTKRKEWGHLLVDNLFVDSFGNAFPVSADMYLRKVDADKTNPFKTVRQIALSQLDYALKQKLPIWLVMLDAGLYADFVLQKIRQKGLKYIVGIRTTNNISISKKKRISVGKYLEKLDAKDFEEHEVDNETYFLHVKTVNTRGVGKEKILISFKQGDEKNTKIYTTNILDKTNKTLMHLLLKRWKVEGLHRDSKQHLGLEVYQVRKFSAIQKVVCAVLVAYTQIILNKTQPILQPFKRKLQTIGEGCRFLRLIALKGWRWLKSKTANPIKLKKILNLYVFVKNAKV